jgi:hypothetical protein
VKSRLRYLAQNPPEEAQSLSAEPLICGVDVSGGGAAWNVIAYRRGGDARSIPRIRIPGEHTRDRSVLVGKLTEILRDQRDSQSHRHVYRHGIRLADLRTLAGTRVQQRV